MSASHLQTRPFATDVYMVPDDEVHQCPLCNKKFQPVIVPKHHCRNCGKVICGACSSNQITLAGAKGTRQRVCDNCYQLLNHAKGESLTEDHINHETQKQSYKNDITEKRKQRDWFQHFLLQIASDASDLGTLPEASIEDPESPTPSSPEQELLAGLRTLEPELQSLVLSARERWKEACSDRAEKRRANLQLEQQTLRIKKEHEAVTREIEKIEREIKNMEDEKKNVHAIEADRDKLRVVTAEQQDELDSIEGRINRLQEDRNMIPLSQGPPSSVGSTNDSCQERCSERCTRPGCSLM